MGATRIEWADYTFNPWIGCTKVDDLCTNCYAESDDKRRQWTPEGWGKGKPRKRTSVANWQLVRRLNDRATEETSNVQRSTSNVERSSLRVFSASLADWLDDEVPIEWLADFLSLVHETPNLTWMLLTKRPENFAWRLGRAAVSIAQACKSYSPKAAALVGWLDDWGSEGKPPANVWIGTSVGNQKSADLRIPQLLRIPARVRFLSCEPLLGPVDLKFEIRNSKFEINWVICGGESGPHARPMHPDWARSLRDQCAAAGAPFFFKQWGEWAPFGALAPEVELPNWNKVPIHDFRPVALDALVYRVGKKTAGRLLDGAEHNAFPPFTVERSTLDVGRFPQAPEALLS